MTLLGSIQRTELEQLIHNQLSEDNKRRYLHSKLAEAARVVQDPSDTNLPEYASKDSIETEKQVLISFDILQTKIIDR